MREFFWFKTMVKFTVIFVTYWVDSAMDVHVHVEFSKGNIQGWDIALHCMYIFLQQLIIRYYPRMQLHSSVHPVIHVNTCICAKRCSPQAL